MEKILDGEFRNGLYKNLVEAGYDKAEAQKIVGVKYHASLKGSVIEQINSLLGSVRTEEYDKINFEVELKNLAGSLSELKKIKDIIA